MAKKYLKGCKPSVIDLSVVYTGCDIITCTGATIENGMSLKEIIVLLAQDCYEPESVSWGDIIGYIEEQQDLVDFIQSQLPSVSWGNISGDINEQTDLTALIESFVPGWGDLAGDIENQQDLINYLSDNFYDKEVIDTKINDVAAKSTAEYYRLAEGVTTLPTSPEQGGVELTNAWTWLVPGVTYTVNGTPITTPDDRNTRADWDGTSWSLVDMGELPQAENKIETYIPGETYLSGDQRIWNGQIWSVKPDVVSTTEEPGTGDDWVSETASEVEVIDNLETSDPDKALSANMGTVIKPRILPTGKEFVKIDRPDLDYVMIEVDEDMNIIRAISEPVLAKGDTIDRPDLSIAIIDEDGFILDKKETGVLGDNINKIFTVPEKIDRPDLSFVLVDKNNKVIHAESLTAPSLPPQPIPDQSAIEYIKRYWNPPLESGFDIDDDFRLVDYDLLISEWDAVMNSQVINPSIDPYISKSEIGRTGAGDIPIYRYDFKPPNPKYKVLIQGGTHANEKMYIEVLLRFFQNFTQNWYSDPVLEWMKRTIHFVVLPCRSPYTLAFPEKVAGSRTAPETDPIPMSWTKSGEEVTITFDTAEFPDNGYVDPDNYFTEESAASIEGKTSLTIISVSDTSSIPLDAYRIKTVIDAQTVVIETPAGGGTSGTGLFQVWADPNRNWNPGGTTRYWHNFIGEEVKLRWDNGNLYCYYEGKGTKPYSLKENGALKSLLDNENFDLVYDLHAPAADHYFRYLGHDSIENFDVLLDNMKFFSAQFVDTDFARTISGGQVTGAAAYYDFNHEKMYATIEWGEGLQRATGVEVQDATRWVIVAITEMLKGINND